MVIRRVGVASAAKIGGALYAVMGLIGGCIFAAISMVSAGVMAGTGNSDMPTWFGSLFGIGAIVTLPILYGVMGLVFGALTAVIYNLVAGMTGGLDLEVQ